MNTKNMLFVLVVAVFAGANASGVSELREVIERQRSNDAVGQQQSNEDLLEALREYNNQGAHKKPDAPDVFEHNMDALKGGRIFWRKRIFFGKDESGKDCYRSILQHENNSAFGEVKLVLFHKAAWWNPWSKDSLETLGTYSDQSLHHRFLQQVSDKKRGGVWCPLQKAFVAGLKDTDICGKLGQDYQAEEAKHTSKAKV